MFTAKNLAGCHVAMITPMTRDLPTPRIDWPRLFELTEQLIDAGVTGLLFAGTTGQSATLSHDEHVEVVLKGAAHAHWYAHEKGRSVQLLAGAGSNSTQEAIELSLRIAEQAPIEALLHVTGYYNNPPQEGLIAHFEAIADALAPRQIPIILYNVPGRTASNLAAETTIQLAAHPNIIGIKEASGDLTKVDQIVAATNPDDFRVVSGEDHLVYEIMRRGGTGVISASANRWPRQFQRLTELATAGQWEAAKELQEALLPCVKAVFAVKNPIPLACMFDTAVRLPLMELPRLNEATRQKALTAIETALAIEQFPCMETEAVSATS
ncbi:MAG: 4-hydroxy-tetrahydrodipicolinate synthase [Candidatus Buchananbacteria bacterium RIFCSPHIGHO2_01_FULL_39_8]|uniref:4-hydroxy-tetrahydrodipicolinate synthase n=1 Tax=Candidatus Buchananbacteria bacterium RIFCSPHIGHO2_01_FULL_39_8 TaxID=1797533 RepID=A0A1G1XTB8_9BACT|nr:MAG: 4-hydroxy-tetrahydrodipicolinate synthase [Candidatus Buchananbacteria bacterium RIFCSPHIGHO2_01_FULL_39_8]